ncbi:MAG: cobalamin-binding protein, partial [Fervidobacterium nodosum]
LVQQDPDVIIIGAYGDVKSVEQAVKNHSIMKNLKAVKNNKILVVDGDEVSQAAPHIFKYLDIFYNFFYGGK